VSPQIESAPAVVVDGVSKRFRIPHERVHTLKERVLHPMKRSGHDDLQALRGVSFAVQPGEFFGIVGRNGSGKSTLLKCMAGIYKVDQGDIYVNGRLATFIELGVGFNPDLAAHDNILLNAVMLGLSPSEARERVERVIEFAELQEFRELKLKNYSSGMHVRLAFSVMLQVDADILLIDEVLAVGDAAFQQKCYDEFHRLRAEQKTILFVTHDMAAVRRFCGRALVMERGDVVAIGDPERISDEYLRLNFPDEALPASVTGDGELEDQDAVILDAWFEDEEGTRHEALPQGRPCSFRASVTFNSDVDDPSFELMIRDEENRNVFGTSTTWADEHTGHFAAGDQTLFGVSFDNLFATGRYYATLQVARRGGGQVLLDRRERVATFVSTGPRNTGGVVDLPHEVEVARRAPAPAEGTKA
jgi:ABC-type polysaccharide/polyol phosphate transport system ATPase subunit